MFKEARFSQLRTIVTAHSGFESARHGAGGARERLSCDAMNRIALDVSLSGAAGFP